MTLFFTKGGDGLVDLHRQEVVAGVAAHNGQVEHGAARESEAFC